MTSWASSVGASPTQIKAAWRRLARDQPPRPDRRRPGRVAPRDPADGRDQRRLRGADPRNAERPSRNGGGRADETPFEPGVGAPPRRAAATEADPAGHRPGRHERRLPAAQPGGRQQRRPDAAARPAAQGHRRRRPRSRCAPRRRPGRSSATGCATSGGRRRPRWPPPRRRSCSFGKFHDHTLGQIAAFEPSYIDWVAGTVNHDPDLVSAARVIQADLDRRGIARGAPRAGRPDGDDPQPPEAIRQRLDPSGKARSPPDTGRRP